MTFTCCKYSFYNTLRNFIRYELAFEDKRAKGALDKGYLRFVVGVDADDPNLEKPVIQNSINEVGVKWLEIGYCTPKDSSLKNDNDNVVNGKASLYQIRRLYVTYEAEKPVAFYSNKSEVVVAKGICTTYFDNEGQPYGVERDESLIHEPFNE